MPYEMGQIHRLRLDQASAKERLLDRLEDVSRATGKSVTALMWQSVREMLARKEGITLDVNEMNKRVDSLTQITQSVSTLLGSLVDRFTTSQQEVTNLFVEHGVTLATHTKRLNKLEKVADNREN